MGRIMSSNLNWEPVKRAHKTLSDATKFIFRDEWRQPIENTLSSGDISFLRGILRASQAEEVKADMKVLIEAIEKYGEVRIWEEF